IAIAPYTVDDGVIPVLIAKALAVIFIQRELSVRARIHSQRRGLVDRLGHELPYRTEGNHRARPDIERHGFQIDGARHLLSSGHWIASPEIVPLARRQG